jgi:hypothetical protein
MIIIFAAQIIKSGNWLSNYFMLVTIIDFMELFHLHFASYFSMKLLSSNRLHQYILHVTNCNDLLHMYKPTINKKKVLDFHLLLPFEC